ncbi:MAG TPA: hypothetical protein VMZ53_14555 [Kofleriaceae bacterium]|nr:hypothetical protein [Kofleriaceae bacterium]
MRRAILGALMLGGCLYNPSVDVDKQAVTMPQGTHEDVVISLDGEAINDFDGVYWVVDDPAMITVAPAWDGKHLTIGGNLPGVTRVHVNSHGQTFDIEVQVGPPAIVKMWIEPEVVQASVGGDVQVKAIAVDTTFHIVDISHESRWTIRNPDLASLDMNGMMLHASAQGQTTLHAVNGGVATVVPITILK